jgi:Clr5 domain
MVWTIQKLGDWEPYDAEIRSLFIERGWTLKQTMKHMEDNYGVRATLVRRNLSSSQLSVSNFPFP